MVRCKFVCISKEPGSGGVDLSLMAVHSGSPENEQFWALTPSGNITFYTANEAAASQFEAGGEYYVDFTLASGDAADDSPESLAALSDSILLSDVVRVTVNISAPALAPGPQDEKPAEFAARTGAPLVHLPTPTLRRPTPAEAVLQEVLQE
jgi:hypothetical protein